MKPKMINILILLSVVIIVSVLAIGLRIDQKTIPNELVGKPAYPVHATWFQGGDSSDVDVIERYRGRKIVLNFWASWCVSCREEARELESAWQKLKDKGVVVVGVAIQDEITAARSFAETYGKTYMLGLDTKGNISIDYGVTGVPETFIIDEGGIVSHRHVGPVSMSDLEKWIQ